MSRRLLNYSMDIPKAAVEPGPLRRMHCVVHSTIRGDMNLSSRDVSGPVSLDMRLKVCKVAMQHCERLQCRRRELLPDPFGMYLLDVLFARPHDSTDFAVDPT
jgi:hypothetical protein